MPTVMIPWASR